MVGVKPKVGDKYSPEAAIRFNLLVRDKVLQSFIRGINKINDVTIRQKRIVSLELIDVETKSDSDIFIAKVSDYVLN